MAEIRIIGIWSREGAARAHVDRSTDMHFIESLTNMHFWKIHNFNKLMKIKGDNIGNLFPNSNINITKY
jgi:hypothetical protein